jgi:hypothetical protein
MLGFADAPVEAPLGTAQIAADAVSQLMEKIVHAENWAGSWH